MSQPGIYTEKKAMILLSAVMIPYGHFPRSIDINPTNKNSTIIQHIYENGINTQIDYNNSIFYKADIVNYHNQYYEVKDFGKLSNLILCDIWAIKDPNQYFILRKYFPNVEDYNNILIHIEKENGIKICQKITDEMNKNKIIITDGINQYILGKNAFLQSSVCKENDRNPKEYGLVRWSIKIII